MNRNSDAVRGRVASRQRGRFVNLPNILTYGRILAIPALVACFFVKGDWGRWAAMWIFIAAWSLWAGVIILCREILVSGLREFLGTLAVSVPVTRVAKWKTFLQMLAIGFLLAGSAGDKIWPYTTLFGLTLLWIAAILTLYTGYDYMRAAVRHVMIEED